jgi:hypothetical protein
MLLSTVDLHLGAFLSDTPLHSALDVSSGLPWNAEKRRLIDIVDEVISIAADLPDILFHRTNIQDEEK